MCVQRGPRDQRLHAAQAHRHRRHLQRLHASRNALSERADAGANIADVQSSLAEQKAPSVSALPRLTAAVASSSAYTIKRVLLGGASFMMQMSSTPRHTGRLTGFPSLPRSVEQFATFSPCTRLTLSHQAATSMFGNVLHPLPTSCSSACAALSAYNQTLCWKSTTGRATPSVLLHVHLII